MSQPYVKAEMMAFYESIHNQMAIHHRDRHFRDIRRLDDHTQLYIRSECHILSKP